MFVDRSERLGENPPMKGYGVAVTPGADGPMLFVTGFGCPNRLYTFDGRRIRDRGCGILADPDRRAIGVAAADVDADGKEEIYVHNTDAYGGYTDNGDMLLDRIAHDERELWCDVFGLDVNYDRGNFHAGRSVAAVDRFGTGRYGMLVACYGVPSRFYELGDDGELTDMADAVGLRFTDGCRSVIAGPIVSESMDVFVGAERGPNRLFRNDNGHFVDIAEAFGLTDKAGNARGAALLDNTAGGFDIAVGNWEGPCRLFTREGDRFRETAPDALIGSERVRNLVVADFDNDGRQELFVNAIGAENRLFQWENRRLEAIDPGDAFEPRGLGTGATVADIDGDGTLELIVVHGEVSAQPLSLFSVPNDNRWLRVRPTTQYGAPARGALVEMETTAGTHRRVIDAGSSYLCQAEPVAHFGLGTDRTPLSVTVRWPDGRTRTIDNPNACSEHTIPHPLSPPGR
ncbi:CRTAC1 family protein [Halalkalirubrum salinum]|uniref:CRTAC1 family protein n=1 Tax=Halalkalirubrum salinum TaxID=2563889 RepID=UPI0010FB7B13|nr:CRTAC1 family protein [Halalkalirubrum salinum]